MHTFFPFSPSRGSSHWTPHRIVAAVFKGQTETPND